MPTIYQTIQSLLQYGIENNLLRKEDEFYTRNRLMSVLALKEWEISEPLAGKPSIHELLESILDFAEERKLISDMTTERDLLNAELMTCLLPRPSEVIREFWENYAASPIQATDQFYKFSAVSNYIRMDRIQKNRQWKTKTEYGELDITINLSKPEKNPREIARLKNAPSSTYPLCLLCPENEGYKGTLTHPARGNHRIIPLLVNQEEWYLQYSPYVYYPEHCIVLKREHVPMKISRETFDRLLDFVDQFPHYFIGSNADLPIVGGSILNHDHFQGGRYTFAIEEAPITQTFAVADHPNVAAGIVKWPMSVIRLRGEKEDIAEVTSMIWKAWQTYSDERAEIHAFSGSTPHNTVTPIARMRDGLYEMDIVLRNNRTSKEHPDGIFHPHQELHHLKKENIGLIEVMGLAVLPGRLVEEMSTLSYYLVNGTEKADWQTDMLKHYDWYEEIRTRRGQLNSMTVDGVIKEEIGRRFLAVLEHSGVFKQTKEGQEAFSRFIMKLNHEQKVGDL